ncbi:MAG: hypothetical protein COA99_16530 [Moraxellaceae bacterium]|nr:MAG: hypothetical protein COA99_16530 [Moraxellaceae bacterium]
MSFRLFYLIITMTIITSCASIPHDIATNLYPLPSTTTSNWISFGNDQKYNHPKHNGAKYKGGLKHFQPHGKGEYIASNGDHYIGSFRAGLMSGKGTITYGDSGDIYTGDFRNDQPNGNGQKRFSSGTIAKGRFSKSFLSSGTLSYADGRKLIGNFKLQLLQGKGEKILANGDSYRGEFVNGALSGNILFTPKSSQHEHIDYLQVWNNGQKTYQAPGNEARKRLKQIQPCKLSKRNSKWIYVKGGCANGLAQGEGEVLHFSGEKWTQGIFNQGSLIFGTMRSSYNTVQVGNWINFKPHGTSDFYKNGILHYKGMYVSGTRHGPGVCIYSDAYERCEYSWGTRSDPSHKEREHQQWINRCQSQVDALNSRLRSIADNKFIQCEANDSFSNIEEALEHDLRELSDSEQAFVLRSTSLVKSGYRCLKQSKRELKKSKKDVDKSLSTTSSQRCFSPSELTQYRNYKNQIAENANDVIGSLLNNLTHYDKASKKLSRSKRQNRKAADKRHTRSMLRNIHDDMINNPADRIYRQEMQEWSNVSKQLADQQNRLPKFTPPPHGDIATEHYKKSCIESGNSWNKVTKVCQVILSSEETQQPITNPASSQ